MGVSKNERKYRSYLWYAAFHPWAGHAKRRRRSERGLLDVLAEGVGGLIHPQFGWPLE